MESQNKNIRKCTSFLRENSILVLATQGQDGPHTSLMAYCCSEDGRRVYMLCGTGSKKWLNMQENSSVSLLVDDRADKIKNNRADFCALTVSGCLVVPSEQEHSGIIDLFAQQQPAILKFFSGNECGIIVIEVKSFLLLEGPVNSFHAEI